MTSSNALSAPFNELMDILRETRRDTMMVKSEDTTAKIHDRRKDPVDVLPVDVMLLVFEKFEHKQLLVCATVSHRWHNYMFSLPVWSRLQVHLHQTSTSTTRARRKGLAKVIGPELRVVHIKTSTSVFSILSLFSKAGCTNLKKFGMQDIFYSWYTYADGCGGGGSCRAY